MRYHTTGRAGMSRLEKIVYLADLTEEGRHYPDVAEMRRWADRSLDGAMLYALCYTIGKLCRRKSPLCRESWQAYNEYVKLCKEEKAAVSRLLFLSPNFWIAKRRPTWRSSRSAS